jgi:hypothetical protein
MSDTNALKPCERALDLIDELYRKYGVELDTDDVAIAQAARAALTRPEQQTEPTDAVLAARLEDQSDEPFPGSDGVRLHYWRDKALTVAKALRERTAAKDNK